MKTFKKLAATSCFVIMGLSLGSCELLGPKPVAKLPLAPVAKEKKSNRMLFLKNCKTSQALAKQKSQRVNCFRGQIGLYPATQRKTEEPTQKGQAHTA